MNAFEADVQEMEKKMLPADTSLWRSWAQAALNGATVRLKQGDVQAEVLPTILKNASQHVVRTSNGSSLFTKAVMLFCGMGACFKDPRRSRRTPRQHGRCDVRSTTNGPRRSTLHFSISFGFALLPAKWPIFVSSTFSTVKWRLRLQPRYVLRLAASTVYLVGSAPSAVLLLALSCRFGPFPTGTASRLAGHGQ